MDKGLTVPKWVLRNWLKIPQSLSAQIACPSTKVWDLDEKRLHWESLVRGIGDTNDTTTHLLISKLFHASIVADK